MWKYLFTGVLSSSSVCTVKLCTILGIHKTSQFKNNQISTKTEDKGEENQISTKDEDKGEKKPTIN